MSSQPQVIHHLVPASELRAGCKSDRYRPERFSEDGFVHCSASAARILGFNPVNLALLVSCRAGVSTLTIAGRQLVMIL